MRVSVLGGGREVGRAAIAVLRGDKAVMLDYGVNFDEEDRPCFPLHIRPKDVEAVVLTHTHLDHIGAAPALYVSARPRAYATSLTKELMRLMLEDFLKISGYYLLFEEPEVVSLLDSTIVVDYTEEVVLDRFLVKLYDAGHIPGSAAVYLEVDDVRLVYTGDINYVETKLVGPAKVDGVKAEVLIMESTYGNAKHPPRRFVEKRFVEHAREVVESGGVVLVPAFSVGRGQEIVAVLMDHGFEHPVFIDGMIRSVSEYMLRYRRFLRRPELLERALSEYVLVRGWQDRRRVWRSPGVIVASAGMLKGGPALYYLKKIGDDPKNAVFLVSFQAPGTPGRNLLETGSADGRSPPLRARLEWFDFSSHADSDSLLRIADSIRGLEKVILVHGEGDSLSALAERIRDELGIDDVIIAENGAVIEV